MKTKVNEIKVSYRERITVLDSPTITSSKVAARVLFDHWDKNTISLQETFKILLLNNSNKVKGIYPLSVGGITGTMVDIRLLFAIILKSLSVGVILTHNHPSGKLKPSDADKKLIEKIKKASKLLDINILDHLIISPNGQYYSFADEGIL